jgi:hypothetical protein
MPNALVEHGGQSEPWLENMTIRQCSHSHQVAGMRQCDFSRAGDGQTSLYSAQIRVNICASCGLIQFYCEAHQDVCAWLATDLSKRNETDPFAHPELLSPKDRNRLKSGVEEQFNEEVQDTNVL